MLRTSLLVAMPVIALAGPTNAGNVCGDFTRAVHEHNDSLYEGFIYGYVVGWTRNRNAIATKAVAEEVRRLTMKYCLEKPDDDLSNVVATWTEIVVKSFKQ